MEIIHRLLFLVALLFGWAFVGHGVWMLCIAIFRQTGGRSCPDCSAYLRSRDMACASCGWSSKPISRERSFLLCRQALDDALKRGAINQAFYERGLSGDPLGCLDPGGVRVFRETSRADQRASKEPANFGRLMATPQRWS
jgi:hypothetical protein